MNKFTLPSTGDKIIIKEQEYEVLSIREEADYVKPPYTKVRLYFAIYLHKVGSKVLHPTHCLNYYSDKNEFYFFTIEQPKPPKWLKHPRQRGHLTSFKDSKKIYQKDIKNKSKEKLNKILKLFSEVEKNYKKEFIDLYKAFIEDPKNSNLKKKAEGLGIRSGPQFSKAINDAALGTYKIELGELSVEEAKQILEKLKKLQKELEE